MLSCRKGFSLIETLLALVVLSVISTLVISLSLQITSLISFNKLRNEKAALAQQLLEQVRSYYQERGYASLAERAGANGYCYLNTDVYLETRVNCNPNNLPYAIVKLTSFSDHVRAEAIIKWTWKGKEQTITDKTSFYSY